MAYLPATYTPTWNAGMQMYQQPTLPQQSGAQQPSQGLIWVDGEVGAKAYQMPAGWPANQPIALWDTNDTVIYLKSINAMGMPNPLQKARYVLEEYKSASVSGEAPKSDMSDYVRKDEMERIKQELMDAINNVGVTRKHGRSDET